MRWRDLPTSARSACRGRSGHNHLLACGNLLERKNALCHPSLPKLFLPVEQHWNCIPPFSSIETHGYIQAHAHSLNSWHKLCCMLMKGGRGFVHALANWHMACNCSGCQRWHPYCKRSGRTGWQALREVEYDCEVSHSWKNTEVYCQHLWHAVCLPKMFDDFSEYIKPHWWLAVIGTSTVSLRKQMRIAFTLVRHLQ